MKSSGKITKSVKRHRVSVIVVHMALLGTLTACTEAPFFGERDESDTPSSVDASAGQPDSSFSQNNSINADGFVQVEASAETDLPEVPELGTAIPDVVVNPLAVISSPATNDTVKESEGSPEATSTDPDGETTTSDSSASQKNPSIIAPDKSTETDANPSVPVVTDTETTDTSTKAPAETASDSGTDTESPAAKASDSATHTESPAEATSDSAAGTESPAEAKSDSNAGTESAGTESPAEAKSDPAAGTESPAEATSDSTAGTESPAEAKSDSDLNTGARTDSSADADAGSAIESEDELPTVFTSHTTPGFTGEVIDDSIHVRWNKDPDALGYNIYRQAKYVTTVWENSYVETDLFDQDYYYEIQAFDKTKKIYYYVATGLTVSVNSAGRTDPAKPKANPDQLKDYELIFADEFNGDSLDTSKWNTSLLWGEKIIINNEIQFYVDIKNKPDFGFNPFTFDGENLTINSIKTPSELSEKALGQPYLSGVITSYDSLQFIYGYAEMRARFTFGRGYWPAFWLLNAYYGQGGDDPEIDIMEFIGHNQDVVYHTYHYYDADGQLHSTKSKPTPGIDYTGDFHTFGVEWKPGTIIYYIDGIEVHRVTDPKVSQQTMYVIANTAMGGWWAGNPDETTPFPGKYMIDYIRVYQRTTPYDDLLFNDAMTDIPFFDDIPDQAIPNHRPSPEQWPAGYPHRQQ